GEFRIQNEERDVREGLRWLIRLVIGSGVALVLIAGTAYAVGTIVSPASPVSVTEDGAGKPVPFTIVATNFANLAKVRLETCDGLDATDSAWVLTLDCDLGTQTGAISSTGTSDQLTFPAGDINFGVQLFHGNSPEGLFSCLSPDEWSGTGDQAN